MVDLARTCQVGPITAICIVVLQVAGCCGVPAPAARAVEDLPAQSYLTGPELAERILKNVVRIDRVDAQERGAGFVVGEDGAGLLIVTAAPVVGSTQSVAARVRVRPCAAAALGMELVGEPIRLEGIEDVALVRIPKVPQLAIERNVVADLASVRREDEAWVAGIEGSCNVGGSRGRMKDDDDKAAVDSIGTSDRPRFEAFVPGARPSTSGAALVTGGGIVGVMQRARGNFAGATTLAAVKRAAQPQVQMTWLLERSANLPPSRPDAAGRELSASLARYVFEASTARRALTRRAMNEGELRAIVGDYNTAMDRIIEVRSKHDGALSRYWDPETLQRYHAVRAELMAVHQVFLSLTKDNLVNQMYRTGQVPDVVHARMAEVESPLAKLEKDVEALTPVLASPRKKVGD
jgi:hypothetical protein